MKLSYLGTALSGLALTSAAAAIDIQVTFDAQASEVYIDNGDDKTLELIPIFEAAAAHWEEIFLDVYLVQAVSIPLIATVVWFAARRVRRALRRDGESENVT